jgi:hypothetical protein
MRTMTTDDSLTTPNSSFLLDDDSRYEYYLLKDLLNKNHNSDHWLNTLMNEIAAYQYP